MLGWHCAQASRLLVCNTRRKHALPGMCSSPCALRIIGPTKWQTSTTACPPHIPSPPFSPSQRLALWADATTAAFAAAGADEPAMSTQSSGGSSVLIKAHNRSAEAEAYVQAAAAARALSASPAQQQGQAALVPPRPSLQLAPLAMPPLPLGTPRRSPARQPTPQRAQQAQPSPLRQQYGTAPSPLVSPPRQAYPSAPRLPLSAFPAASPQQRPQQQQQQQLYPSPSPQFVQRQQLTAGPGVSLPPQQLFP